MAISATALFSARADGSNNNGGAFNAGNGSFATDLTATSGTGASPVVSSASYSFVAGDVGAWLFVKSGTNWTPGFYQIASVSAGSATLTASVGSVRLYSSSAPGYTTGLNTTAGVATTASPTGGTWGIDYSLSASARTAYTDLVIGATTTQFTSAANPVGKNLVGNHIQVTSGTGFTTGLYEVVSTSGTTATCDRSLGTASSTGGNANLGGGYASPGLASNSMVANGCVLRIKPGTYSISSATAGAAGGPIILKSGAFTAPNYYAGCDVMLGDTTTKPLLQATTGSLTILTRNATTHDYTNIINLDVDGNSQTSTRGIDIWSNSFIRDCKVRRCSNTGILGTGTSSAILHVINCEVTGCITTGYGVQIYGVLTGCYVHDNSVPGAWATEANACQFDTNSGIGFTFASAGTTRATNCTAYANTASGFFTTTGGDNACTIENCISYGNSAYAVGGDRNAGQILIINLAAGSNTSGRIQRTYQPEVGAITLTGDPFTDGPNGNFALNNTAGFGAACRAAGYPTSFPGGLTANYRDVGSAQHQDSGGSGGVMVRRAWNGGYTS